MTDKQINIIVLQKLLAEKPQMPVKFLFGDSVINPGYHITEIKHATIKSVDCGKSSDIEYWDEISVQLLDGAKNSTQGHMSASKCLGIINTALQLLSAESDARLFFEYAPNNGPLVKLHIDSVKRTDDAYIIILDSEHAVCKPFQRAKAASLNSEFPSRALEQPLASGCCASAGTPSHRTCCE